MQSVAPSRTPEARDVLTTYDLAPMTRALLGQWRLILASSLGVGLVFFSASFLLHKTYKATTIVMPPDRTNSSLSMLGGASGGAGASVGAMAALGVKSPSDLCVALMTSPGVQDAIVQQFDLQKLYGQKYLSLARKQFESNADIAADPKSGLIFISVTDRDPNRAAAMSNAVVDAFLHASTHLAMTDAARRRLFFERQIGETKQNLNRAEETLRNVKNRTGLIEPEGDARALISYQAQLRAQVTTKTVELQSLKVYLSDENPQVQTAQRELQGLEAQADALNRKSGGDTFDSKSVATEASLEYLRDLRDLRYNETLLELLVKNLEIAKLDEAREGSLVQVVDAAMPPDLKYGPHRSLFLAGGFVFGLLLSSVWVLIRRHLLVARRTFDPSNG